MAQGAAGGEEVFCEEVSARKSGSQRLEPERDFQGAEADIETQRACA